MKIVVLAAGTSTERDVSIVSGTGVCKALNSIGHHAILVDVFFGCPSLPESDHFPDHYDTDQAAQEIRNYSVHLEKEKQKRRSFFGPHVIELCLEADFVFLTLHGSNGEDGRIQAALDLLGVQYSGTDYISSAVAMDKTRTKQIFALCGIPTPLGTTVHKGQCTAEELLRELPLPLIVKPQCGGSSIGVTICHTEEELQQGLDLSFSFEEAAIVEEFIEGRELTVAVMGREAYPVVEIAPINGFYDYKNKYLPGMTIETCPAKIPDEKTEEIQRLAVQAAEALGIQAYVRMDFLMREDGRLYCLEANTLPGMTPTSLVPQEAAALGIDYPSLCQKMIDLSLEKYRDQQPLL